MMYRQTLFLAGVLAATAVAAACVHAQDATDDISALTLQCELTLESGPTSPLAEVPDAVPASRDVSLGLARSSEQLRDAPPWVDANLPRPKSPDGVESFSIQDVTAVEYRTGAGIGLGVATNGGWCISQSFMLGRNLDLSMFYLNNSDLGSKIPEIQFPDIGRTIGLRLNWSF